MTILVTLEGSNPMLFIWLGRSHQQHEVFQSKMYASCFQPLSYRVMLPSFPLMIPTLAGKSKRGILCLGSVLPGMKARSGMNAPEGTLTNRLLSTSQAEQSGAF